MDNSPPEAPNIDEKNVLVNHLRQVRNENGYSTAVWTDERLNRAAQGFMEYRKIIQKLSPKIASKIINFPGIQMCFLGIVPVEQFKTELTEDEVVQINSALALNGEKYFVLSFPIPLSRQKNHALINFEAAEAIISENKDLFLNIGDPRKFLKTQPSQYLAPAALFSGKIQDERHGLLSGYPKDCVLTWSRIMNSSIADRFLKKPKAFGVGSFNEGIFFQGFNERNRQWANEAIALRKTTGIAELH